MPDPQRPPPSAIPEGRVAPEESIPGAPASQVRVEDAPPEEPEVWADALYGSLTALELRDRKVLIRSDLSLELNAEGQVGDDSSLQDALPTIRYAREQGAKVIVAAHRMPDAGAPTATSAPSLEPAAAHLAALLECDVFFPDDCVSDAAKRVILDLREGQVCVLENLARHPGEMSDDTVFAGKLAAHADIYVNDAPRLIEQRWASLCSIVPQVRHHCIGFGLRAELEHSKALVASKGKLGLLVASDDLNQLISVIDAVAPRLGVLGVVGPLARLLIAARSPRERDAAQQEESQLSAARGLIQRLDNLGANLALPKLVERSPTEVTQRLGEALAACPTLLAIRQSADPQFDLILDTLAQAKRRCVVSQPRRLERVDRGSEIFYSRLGKNLLHLIAGGRFPALEALEHAAS